MPAFADECTDIGEAILNNQFKGEISLFEASTDIEFWKVKSEECSQINKRFNWKYVLSQNVYKYTPDKIKKKIAEKLESQSRQYEYVEKRILSNFNSLKNGKPTSGEIASFASQRITPTSLQSIKSLHPKVHILYLDLEEKRLTLLSQLQSKEDGTVQLTPQPTPSEIDLKKSGSVISKSNMINEIQPKVNATDTRYLKELALRKKQLQMKVSATEKDLESGLYSLEKFSITPPLIHQASEEVQIKFKALEKEKILAVERFTKLSKEHNAKVDLLSNKGAIYEQEIERQYDKADSLISTLDKLDSPVETITQVINKLDEFLSNRDMALERALSESRNREHSILSTQINYTLSKIESLKSRANNLFVRYEKKEKTLALKRQQEQEQEILRQRLPQILEVAEHSLQNKKGDLMPLDSKHISEYIKRSMGNQKLITMRLMKQAEEKDKSAQKEMAKILLVDAIEDMGYSYDDTIKSIIVTLIKGEISPFNKDVLLGTATIVTLTNDAKDKLLSFGFISKETYQLLEVSHLSL